MGFSRLETIVVIQSKIRITSKTKRDTFPERRVMPYDQEQEEATAL